MNATQLLEHFDRLAEAPNAVPRLRRFILDLAVRGKLVEQDAGDEPAVELLKRIREEKLRLANEGLAKKEKPLLAVDSEEHPFSIPNSWRWVRLQDITSYIQRGKSPNYAASDGVPVVSQKCVQWRGLDLNSARLITRESLGKYEPVRFLQDQDLLWNSTGTGTIGRVVRVISPPKNLVCDSHVTVVRCALANSEYVRSWLATDHVYGSIEDRAAGATNQVELNSSMAAQQVVPIPPLAEQDRIVAKVDELMALCDQLEAAQQERERRRDRLAAASLQRLNQPAADTTPEAQREHARFHLHHLPHLTVRPEHIKAMRQTILNFAVQGRLLVHDQGDPSTRSMRVADVALQQMSDEIHGDPEVLGIRFCLPVGWLWRTGDQVADFVDPQPSHRTPSEVMDGIPYIGYGDIKSVGRIDFANARKVSLDVFREHKERYALKDGDFVIGKIGTIGQPHVLPSPFEYTLSANLILVQPSEEVTLSRYLVMFFSSPLAESALKTHKTDSTHAVFGIKKARLLLIPTPPLAEQHRIVAKVDELMALCDQLEAQLTTTQTDSRRLLEAVLEVALAPA